MTSKTTIELIIEALEKEIALINHRIECLHHNEKPYPDYTIPAQLHLLYETKNNLTFWIQTIKLSHSKDDFTETAEWWCRTLALECLVLQRCPVFDIEYKTPMLDEVAKQFKEVMELNSDHLPLLQSPQMKRRPSSLPLSPNWERKTCLRKSELRAWAAEHAPDWLDCVVLAGPSAAPAQQPSAQAQQPVSLAEQWAAADAKAKGELAQRVLMQHGGNQTKAAQALGISRTRLHAVLKKAGVTPLRNRGATGLRNGVAPVAQPSLENVWSRRKQ